MLCKHVFCDTCLRQWFIAQIDRGRLVVCPLCRKQCLDKPLRLTAFDDLVRFHDCERDHDTEQNTSVREWPEIFQGLRHVLEEDLHDNAGQQ